MIGNSNDLQVVIDSNAIGFSSSSSLSITNQLIEVTKKPTNGWKETITAIKGGVVTFSGLTTADFSSVNTLEDSISNGSRVEFVFGLRLGYQLAGDGFIENLSITGGTDDTMTFDGDIAVSADIATRLSVELQNLQINGVDVAINGVTLMVAVQI